MAATDATANAATRLRSFAFIDLPSLASNEPVVSCGWPQPQREKSP
jgi:hypothetical protein